MVKKSILERFIKLKGYNYVKQVDGAWKGIAEAKRKTGLSEATIRRLLKQHPTPRIKGEAKYVKEFRESEGFKLFRRRYGAGTQYKTRVGHIRRAWLFLNKKDPISWTKEDYEKLWNPVDGLFFVKTYREKRFNGVPEQYAVSFHNLMKATEKLTFLEIFKGKKYPKGGKSEWFLEDEEIIALAGHFEENESLMMLMLGITKGARFSALVLGKPSQLNAKKSTMKDYESKREKFYTRFIQKSVMNLLQRYIRDYKIPYDGLLFNQSYDFYLKQFKASAKRAGITKTVSTHIMKHTFVTQGALHGLSAETLHKQTGTGKDVLSLHYTGENTDKLRMELLGEKWEHVPFHEWIESLMPYFRENYERIKKTGEKVNGIRSKLA